MAKKLDTKPNLEAILGDKISEDAAQLINLVQSVASSTISDGSTTKRNILIARPNQCYRTQLLDVTGFATSGSDGKSKFRLKAFICPEGESYIQPINVVATPLSPNPFYLTVLHTVVDNGADVEIEVFVWDATGAAAPNIPFNWRCRVELQTIFL